MDQKQEYFKCFVYNLANWKGSKFGSTNDLSILKVIKLLFFTTGASIEKSLQFSQKFQNYYAFPLGHVEYDIYTLIRKVEGKFEEFEITNKGTVFFKNKVEFDQTVESEVAEAIAALKNYNPNLINYSAYQLVNLSHDWYSWQKYYIPNSVSQQIPFEVIEKELKYFNLNN